MVHLKKIIILFLLWIGGCLANTNDFIKHYQEESTPQLSQSFRESIGTFKVKSLSEHKLLMDGLKQSTAEGLKNKQKPQEAEGAILFVSFSMPDSLLFALSNEAAQFHIPVVINGLVEGSFKKTIETFKRLNQEAQKQHVRFKGVSIDPVWFSQFQITSVPALVVTKACSQATSCTNQPFDVVYGNASIKKGLELIAQKGDAAPNLARTILESGHV